MIGDPDYNFLADTDDSGAIDFTDFLGFASAFGQEADFFGF